MGGERLITKPTKGMALPKKPDSLTVDVMGLSKKEVWGVRKQLYSKSRENT